MVVQEGQHQLQVHHKPLVVAVVVEHITHKDKVVDLADLVVAEQVLLVDQVSQDHKCLELMELPILEAVEEDLVVGHQLVLMQLVDLVS